MGHDKARNVLADYRQAVVDAGRERPTLVQRSDAVAALNSKIPAVNQVLRELAPDLPLIKATSLTQHRSARAILDKAEAFLNAWKTLDDASAGESPALPLTMLDSVVADAALPLWKVGKYRQAVNDAATNLNLYAQQQLGRRDISDKSLMGEAFSDKPSGPAPGRRWPNSPDLRLSLAQRPALRLQLAPGRLRPPALAAHASSRTPAAGELAWQDDTRRLAC